MTGTTNDMWDLLQMRNPSSFGKPGAELSQNTDTLLGSLSPRLALQETCANASLSRGASGSSRFPMIYQAHY